MAAVRHAAGQHAEALALLEEGLAVWGGSFWAAELYRLKGEILLAQEGTQPCAEAEACFRKALEIVRQRDAKSFELRAATSLARLLRNQGKRDEARALLAPIYHWFTEGFDTRDLIEAKSLLEELGT